MDPALAETDLIDHCRKHLTSCKVPVIVEFRSDPLPGTNIGKVLLRALRRKVWVRTSRRASAAGLAPQGEGEDTGADRYAGAAEGVWVDGLRRFRWPQAARAGQRRTRHTATTPESTQACQRPATRGLEAFRLGLPVRLLARRAFRSSRRRIGALSVPVLLSAPRRRRPRGRTRPRPSRRQRFGSSSSPWRSALGRWSMSPASTRRSGSTAVTQEKLAASPTTQSECEPLVADLTGEEEPQWPRGLRAIPFCCTDSWTSPRTKGNDSTLRASLLRRPSRLR